MLSKIFLGVLFVAFIVMGIVTYLSYSWLQSVTNPADVAQSYLYFANIGWNALWICFILLIIFANVILWKSRRAWALWSSFLFFAVCLVAQTFWLNSIFYSFAQENNLTGDGYILKPFIGAVLVLIAAIAVFFNQFIVLRLRDKLYGTNANDGIKAE
ncbi:MAG: hypothetical protein ACK5NT_14590 [Pyrinomonadaceae bacterium]